MRRRAVRVVLVFLAALVAAPLARATLADEAALAERYAPVVRLVEQAEDCGYGEPYLPIDVDLVFDEPTVALRGPWSTDDLIEIGPSAQAVSAGLYEHHLDFPGRALDPRCDYERWSDRLAEDSVPTVYAHVATDPGYPGKLALQYWFFYAFNDFNNKHEGDWEMIQLVFGADDAPAALAAEPLEVGYSQHEGAERVAWGDEKLQLVGDTHPVVHPAAGSHANYFDEALYLGRSAAQGIGCDDTTAPTFVVRPVVRTIPSEAAAARRAFPWITYEGRWGELQEAFFNGPTGPNLKRQWTEPIAWAEEEWRDRSYAIPGGGFLGTSATSFFCGAVGAGSDVLRRMVDDPLPFLFVLGALLALVLFALTRTTWRPNTPLRVTRRRSWGQTVAAAARMYVARWPVFVGIGLLFIPIGALVDAQGSLLFAASDGEGETGGLLGLLATVIAATVILAGLGLVQSATARALVEIDERRPIDPLRAYRLAFGRLRPLLAAVVAAGAIIAVLSLSLVLLPVAIWLVGRWALVAHAVQLENASALGALRRSSELVRGRWFKVASLAGVGAAIALALGPVVGAVLIVATDAPFAVLNVFAGVVYALAVPLVALTTTYLYFDAVVRARLEPSAGVELPSEL